jgi:hypothetical protein
MEEEASKHVPMGQSMLSANVEENKVRVFY